MLRKYKFHIFLKVAIFFMNTSYKGHTKNTLLTGYLFLHTYFEKKKIISYIQMSSLLFLEFIIIRNVIFPIFADADTEFCILISADIGCGY